MVKKTKKNEIIIDGNKFVQNFNDIQFVQDYIDWKDNCRKISGSDMGVDDSNIPSLFDFLQNHIFNNVREGSKNAGADDGSNGAIEALSAIEDIMEDRVIYQSDIEKIKKLYKRMGQMQDNKGPDGLALDPKLILFTEKTKRGGKRKLYGHFATPEYIARKKAKDSKFKGKAVDAGWYSGQGNPPSFALFSSGPQKYAKPKGLLYILDDAIKALDPKGRKRAAGGGSPVENEVTVGRLKGKTAVDKLAGIASVEKYFDSAINNEAFWQGGKLRVARLAKDVATKSFSVSPKEAQIALDAMDTPDEKTPAGSLKSFKVELTGTPLILFIKAALERANKKKGGDGYRAWTDKGQFDYRKTAREVYGEDTGRFRPDQKVISKRWTEILKQGFTPKEVDALLDGMTDYMEDITAQMFEDEYEEGYFMFDNFQITISETSRTDGYDGIAFEYEYEYYAGGEILTFATVMVSGTKDRVVEDVFFHTDYSREGFEHSGYFMQQPNIRSVMRRFARDLSGLKERVKG